MYIIVDVNNEFTFYITAKVNTKMYNCTLLQPISHCVYLHCKSTDINGSFVFFFFYIYYVVVGQQKMYCFKDTLNKLLSTYENHQKTAGPNWLSVLEAGH